MGAPPRAGARPGVQRARAAGANRRDHPHGLPGEPGGDGRRGPETRPATHNPQHKRRHRCQTHAPWVSQPEVKAPPPAATGPRLAPQLASSLTQKEYRCAPSSSVNRSLTFPLAHANAWSCVVAMVSLDHGTSSLVASTPAILCDVFRTEPAASSSSTITDAVGL